MYELERELVRYWQLDSVGEGDSSKALEIDQSLGKMGLDWFEIEGNVIKFKMLDSELVHSFEVGR